MWPGVGPLGRLRLLVSAEWRANARQVVQQLRVDIATAAVGGTTPVAAAEALRNTSDLYALLVAYSDLGGCHQMVRSAATACAGRPRIRARVPPSRAGVPRCSRGRRSAPIRRRSSRATHEIGLAEPALVRAMLAIRDG